MEKSRNVNKFIFVCMFVQFAISAIRSEADIRVVMFFDINFQFSFNGLLLVFIVLFNFLYR